MNHNPCGDLEWNLRPNYHRPGWQLLVISCPPCVEAEDRLWRAIGYFRGIADPQDWAVSVAGHRSRPRWTSARITCRDAFDTTTALDLLIGEDARLAPTRELTPARCAS